MNKINIKFKETNYKINKNITSVKDKEIAKMIEFKENNFELAPKESMPEMPDT
ncbi:MAG: hypothetical protein GX889_12810 [Clostridiales bacterium]|nr:hypothetical protein [Clostridiales bacterium]